MNELDATHFQVVVPTQSAEGQYTVTIGAGVTDLSGNHLAPASGYSASFTIDKTPAANHLGDPIG